MYVNFYHFNERAFDPQCKTEFFWDGKSRQAIVAALCDGINGKGGFQLLTGSFGVGKSVLIQRVVAVAAENTKVVVVEEADQDPLDFYNDIAKGFGLDKQIFTKVQFVIELSQLLKNLSVEGKAALLVVDNAQFLNQEALEEIRMLLGLEKDGKKLLNIILVGDYGVVDLLALPANKILRQRLVFQADLLPLEKEETREYVEYRLAAAGAERAVFEKTAFEVLFERSKGVIRNLDSLCTTVLEAGAQQEEILIGPEFIKNAVMKGADVLDSSSLSIPLQSEEPEDEIEDWAKEIEEQIDRELQLQSPESVQKVEDSLETEDDVDFTETASESHLHENEEDISFTGISPVDGKSTTKLSKAGSPKSVNTFWNLSLLLRCVVTIILCCLLYFVYNYFSGPAVSHNQDVKTDSATGQNSQETIDEKISVPIVMPGEQNDKKVTALRGSDVMDSDMQGDIPAEKQKTKIVLHPLQIIQ